MSKNELESMLIYRGVECRSKWEFDLVVDAMVAAYNLGIDDAVGKFVSESDFIDSRAYEALEQVQKLKVG